MIYETLNELNNTNGVIATFFANIDGHIIARTGEVKAIPFKSMANEITAFLKNNKPNETLPLKRFQFAYDNVIIIIQVLDFGFVVVLCEPDHVNALLRLTLDVLFAKIKNNNNTKKI